MERQELAVVANSQPAALRREDAGENEPGCLIECEFCYVKQRHELGPAAWDKEPRGGFTEGAFHVLASRHYAETPAEQDRLRQFPWILLRGEVVGTTIQTDPLLPNMSSYLDLFLQNVPDVARLVIAISRWTASRKLLENLAAIKHFCLVVGITGNDRVEGINWKKHLETLALARELKVPTLPICHPWIPGLSDWSFLPQMRALGYEYYSVRGLWPDPGIAEWLPQEFLHHYKDKPAGYILPDGWQQPLADAGLKQIDLDQWLLGQCQGLRRPPHFTNRQEAEASVDSLLAMSEIISPAPKDEIREAAIRRRLRPLE